MADPLRIGGRMATCQLLTESEIALERGIVAFRPVVARHSSRPTPGPGRHVTTLDILRPLGRRGEEANDPSSDGFAFHPLHVRVGQQVGLGRVAMNASSARAAAMPLGWRTMAYQSSPLDARVRQVTPAPDVTQGTW